MKCGSPVAERDGLRQCGGRHRGCSVLVEAAAQAEPDERAESAVRSTLIFTIYLRHFFGIFMRECTYSYIIACIHVSY